MHARRLTSWLLGLWLGCSLFMFLVATHNFKAVDGLLREPGAAKAALAKLDPVEARMLLRYHSSELNRYYFQAWEFAQLAVLAAVAASGWSSLGRRNLGRVILGLLAAILLFERLSLTPEIIRIGRLIDFTGADGAGQERADCWKLHGMYSGVEVLKVVLVCGLSMMLFSKRHDSGAE